jgi:hypothetical protein
MLRLHHLVRGYRKKTFHATAGKMNQLLDAVQSKQFEHELTSFSQF